MQPIKAPIIVTGLIYCYTSPSGKKYIGQTFRDMDKRELEHINRPDCIAFHQAILKYGIANFKREILHEAPYNQEEFDEKEKQFISELNTMSPNGYNIRSGGANGTHCAESRERMRQSKLGAKNHNFGKPRSEETCLKISAARSGEKHHFYGKELSEEHKLNLSKSHKGDSDLPMYIYRIPARPTHYCAAGYGVANHPTLKKRQWTKKDETDQQKLDHAKAYLNSA